MAPAPKSLRDLQPKGGSASSPLRLLPSIEECLEAADNEPAIGSINREYVKRVMRAVVVRIRHELQSTSADPQLTRAALRDRIIQQTLVELQRPSGLRPLVNATGVLLHTNLGRATLAESAIDAMAQAARSPVNLEYDLATGERGDRDQLIEDDLRALTDAEAATVVNNNAAAVLLVLDTLAKGREVIVSRGELIEIGGAFRIPDVMRAAGARLKEVGATNRTHPRDYRDAINAETALLMKIHPSNFAIVGFTATVELAEIVRIAREQQLDVVEDLGAGALIDLGELGLREPVVRERIAAGAALVTFSGDKLIGGPQAGIIVGRRDLIERLKANPLWRAIRCDKLRLAALHATLQLYLRARDSISEVPVLRLLRRTPASIEQLAFTARDLLIARLPSEFAIEVISSIAQIGSGALPAQPLDSRALRITHPRHAPEAIAAAFRQAGIIGRINGGAFLLDLFAVEDADALAIDFPMP